jgi:splicing factor U2AF subunit
MCETAEEKKKLAYKDQLTSMNYGESGGYPRDNRGSGRDRDVRGRRDDQDDESAGRYYDYQPRRAGDTYRGHAARGDSSSAPRGAEYTKERPRDGRGNGHDYVARGARDGRGYDRGYDRREYSDGPRRHRDRDRDPRDQYSPSEDRRYDSYRSRDEPAREHHTGASESEPPASIQERIRRCERKLAQMAKVPSIDEVTIIDSQWGVKPKGFENVTVQRAKLSGLFPLPGCPRPVDYTKLELLLTDPQNAMLNSSYKIAPIDSRNAKIVIVKGLDFEKVDHLRLAEYFNKFLSKIDIADTSLSNVELKRKTKDNVNLIIEFKNNVCATIAMALNGHQVAVLQVAEDEDATGTLTLAVSRPGEYVTQCSPPYKLIAENADIEDVVVDNPRKVTLIVNAAASETELLDHLKLVNFQVKAFQMLREIGTRQSLGIAFVEYYFDPSVYKNTIKVMPALEGIVAQLKTDALVDDAFLSCVVPGQTGIEDCPMDFKSLRALARGEYVTNHPKLKVVEFINMVTPADLVEDWNYHFIQQDILQECRTFGPVVSVKMPRPANDFTPGISQFVQPGLGKVYVEFEDEKLALDAIMGLAGRLYNDRTVLCAFHNHADFQNGIL